MPFDGSGNFNRVMDWTNDAAANIKIRADRHDQNDDDIAAGLSLTMTRDGQSQPSADLPMNGKKLTNLGAPTNPTDAATKSYADTGLALKANIASPTFTGKVTLPTGVAGTPPVNWPNATAAPTTPADGDIWPDSAGGGLKHRIAGVTYTYGRLEAAQTWTGTQTFAATSTFFGTAGASGQTSVGQQSMEIGLGRSADGVSLVDFHSQFPDVDFSARILRNSGVNGSFQMVNNGTGAFALSGAGAAGTFTWNTSPVLVANLDQLSLSGGYAMAVFANDGTKSSGTYTPTAAGGNFRIVTNGGAFILAADGDTSKAYTLIIYVQNSATAGAITLSGFAAVTGDAFNTINGATFMLSIIHFGGARTINVQRVS